MSTAGRTCAFALIGTALCLALAACAPISAIDTTTYLNDITISNINLATVPANTYEGQYTLVLPPGQYAFNRHFDVLVTVNAGLFTDITIKDPSSLASNSDFVAFEHRIITAGSLRVDGVSGATWSSKAMLKAIETALPH